MVNNRIGRNFIGATLSMAIAVTTIPRDDITRL